MDSRLHRLLAPVELPALFPKNREWSATVRRAKVPAGAYPEGTYGDFCAKVQLLWTCIPIAAEDTIVGVP